MFRPLPYRPLLPLAVAFTSGLILDRLVPVPMPIWWTLGGVCGVMAWYLSRFGFLDRLATVAMLAGIACVAACWHHGYRDRFPERHYAQWLPELSEPALVRGRLIEEPILKLPALSELALGRPVVPRANFVIEVEQVRTHRGWQPACGALRVTVRESRPPVHHGDRVEIAGRWHRVGVPVNPGSIDFRELYLRDRILGQIYVKTPAAVALLETDRVTRSFGWAGRLRRQLEVSLATHMGQRTGSVAAAVCLGSRHSLEENLGQIFVRTGTVHLMAVSGLHLWLLLWLIRKLLSLTGWRSGLQIGLLAVIAVAYVLITNGRPPIVRAALLAFAFWGGNVFGAQVGRANALALAWLVLLVWQPVQLFELSFQLSFAAVGAIVYLVPYFDKKVHQWIWPELPVEMNLFERGGRWLVEALLRAAVLITCVWLVTAPLIALRIHLVSLVGIPTGIVLAPFVSLVLWMGFATALAGLMFDPLAAVFGLLADRLTELMLTIIQFAADLPGAYFYTRGPGGVWVVGVTVIFGAALAFDHRWLRGRWLAAVLGAWLLAGLIAWNLPIDRGNRLHVTTLSVGHGLATLVEFPSGRTLLYDAGSRGRDDVGRTTIAPACWARDIRRIDTLVLSHADWDHLSGVAGLVNRVKVGRVVISPYFRQHYSGAARKLVDWLEQRGIPVQVVAAGDSLDGFGEAELRFLHPPRQAEQPSRPNDRCLVLDIRWQGRRVLLPGDMEGWEGSEWPNPEGARVDVLLVPHHGTVTANPPELAERLRPRLAIFSQGRVVYESPVPHQYRRYGSRVLSTYHDGAVLVSLEVDQTHVAIFQQLAAESSRARVGWRQLLAVFAAVILLAIVFHEAMACSVAAPWRRPHVAAAAAYRVALPEDSGLPCVDFSVTAHDGARLDGWFIPAGKSSAPTVVLVHGICDNRVAYLRLAGHLHDSGYNCYLFDLRAHGTSGGRHCTFGVLEAKDIHRIIDVLSDHPDVDRDRMALVGYSLGGAVGIAAATTDRRIKALVTYGTYRDLLEVGGDFARRFSSGLSTCRLLVRTILWRAGKIAGFDPHAARPVDHVPSLRCPSLWTRGQCDLHLPPRHTEALYNVAPEPKSYYVVPDGNHLTIGRAIDQYNQRVVEFLDEHLRART